MSTTTGKPAFRAGRDAAALSENIELLTGQRGDGLDKAVTYRFLAAIGLANLKKASSSGKYTLTLPNQDDSENIERPVAPTGVIANGAFQSVLIEWDKPAYSGHAYAEIWRANEDNLSSAVMVGTSAANLFSDQIGKGSHVWYWIRFVNRSNTTGPYNSASGTQAITSSDVQDILDELQGQIEYSHLASWLRQDIETQSETAASLVQTISSLDSDMRANGQNILAQQTAILAQFSQIITDINAIRRRLITTAPWLPMSKQPEPPRIRRLHRVSTVSVPVFLQRQHSSTLSVTILSMPTQILKGRLPRSSLR